jgi:hypothetical protein
VSLEIRWRDLSKRGIAAWANQTLDERVIDLLSDIMLASEEIESMVSAETGEAPFPDFYTALYRIIQKPHRSWERLSSPSGKHRESTDMGLIDAVDEPKILVYIEPQIQIRVTMPSASRKYTSTFSLPAQNGQRMNNAILMVAGAGRTPVAGKRKISNLRRGFRPGLAKRLHLSPRAIVPAPAATNLKHPQRELEPILKAIQ